MEAWLTPVRQWWPSQQGALPRPVMHYMNRGTYNHIAEMPLKKWWSDPKPIAFNVIPPGQSGFLNYLGQYSHAYDQLALYETWTYKPIRFGLAANEAVMESKEYLIYFP